MFLERRKKERKGKRKRKKKRKEKEEKDELEKKKEKGEEEGKREGFTIIEKVRNEAIEGTKIFGLSCCSIFCGKNLFCCFCWWLGRERKKK